MIKNKKAEISTTTLITTILLIVGFGILIFLFWRIGFSGMANKEACYASVIMRSTAPSVFGVKGLVTLNCRTDKICITTRSGGKCKEFENTPGVTTVKVKNEDQISKAITDALFDCWTMMGEGRASIFSQFLAETYGFGTVYPSCVVCARVAFDSENLGKSGLDATKVDVEKYMATHYVPNREVTYRDYLAGEIGKVSVSEEIFGGKSTTGSAVDDSTAQTATAQASSGTSTLTAEQKEMGLTEEQAKAAAEAQDMLGGKGSVSVEAANVTPLDFKADTLGIIFMQISAPSAGGAFKNLAMTVGGLLLGEGLMNPGGAWKFAKSLGSISYVKAPFKPATFGSISGVQGTLPGFDAPAEQLTFKFSGAAPTGKTGLNVKAGPLAKVLGALAIAAGITQQSLVAYDRSVAATYCGDISLSGEARDGCSVVRVVRYNPEDFNTYCSVIEGVG